MTDPLALDPVLPERAAERAPVERRPAARRAVRALRGARHGRRQDRAERLDAGRVPDRRPALRRDARQLGAHGRPARARMDHAGARRSAGSSPSRPRSRTRSGTPSCCTGSRRTSASRARQMLEDLIAGKTKFHNVFHYPTKSWGDIGIIAWLVDAAAIVAQQALRDSSYGPYARTMQKICWEESVHIMHGRDVVVTLMTGTDVPAGAGPGGAEPLVGPADADARAARRSREGPRPPLADQGQDVRGAPPGVPDDLRPAPAGARADDPGSRAPLRRRGEGPGGTPSPTGTSFARSSPATARSRRTGSSSGGSTATTRAGSGETVFGLPAVARRVMAPSATAAGRRVPRAALEPYEVFQQAKDGDPMRHGGNVMAPDAELAMHYAREMFGRRNESTRLWVVRRTDIADPRGPGPARPAARPVVQEARGYVMRDKLAAARERPARPSPPRAPRATTEPAAAARRSRRDAGRRLVQRRDDGAGERGRGGADALVPLRRGRRSRSSC